MTDSTILSVQGVSRAYRHHTALYPVTFDIAEGELFGIIGPDGAGKTTLLRMMAGVLNPTSGDILFKNSSIAKDPEHVKQHMGYMPQHAGLYADLSVQENLDFMADVFAIAKSTRAERQEQLYDFTQLGDFKARRAGQLSGGMKKKLGLAGALIHQPPLLLLDEPTTGVDPVARRDFWDLLSGLHSQGTTTVVSTPYMDEAERCSRVALLFGGRLLACASPNMIKADVPGQVLALNSDAIREAEQHLEGLETVIDVQTYGDQLNIIVSGDRDDAAYHIREHLSAQGITIQRLEGVPMQMEEAFIYLIKQAKSGGQTI